MKKKNKPKLLFASAIAVLAAATAVLASPITSAADVSAADVKEIRTYNNQFVDVASDAWYYSSVAGAYSLGLVSGVDDTHFLPDGSVTIAQTIKIAVSCHQLLTGGKVDDSAIPTGQNWYDGYVSYAKQNGIVTEDYENYSSPATRAQTAVLLSRAITSSGADFEEINSISFGDIPDVSVDAWYAGAVYRLYRWGIMTGGTDGKVNPNGTLKRSEISALILRIAYPDKRVDVSKTDSSSSTTAPSPSEPSASFNGSAEIYSGEIKNQSFTGITSFGAEFTCYDGSWIPHASYSLELVNNIILESDNISFRLYKNCGYEALGIVRGWLNGAAVGADGTMVSEISDVYSELNDLFYLFIDGKRVTISELWYADHGDYTTYAFYFDETVDVGSAEDIKLLCGRENSDTLSLCGLGELAVLVDNAEKNLTYAGDINTSVGNEGYDTYGEAYTTAVSDAKESAEILFEEKNSRCLVLYGCGLYGKSKSEYRLIFIFPDGTTQTVATQKLSGIRMSENVLYYTVTAPDGQKLQYGVNFGG
ncbi:MAG: S-layer homology domain-containing protein [Eubacteriales bacterium]